MGLSLDLDTIFGQGHFIRRIPESELSTPEGYLESLRPSVPLPSEEDSMIEYDDAVEDISSKTISPAKKVDDDDDDNVDEIDEESRFLDAESKLFEEKEEGEEEIFDIVHEKEEETAVVDMIETDIEAVGPTNEETPLLSAGK